MKFKFQNGKMSEVNANQVQEISNLIPLSTAHIVDVRQIKESIKSRSRNFLKNTNFAVAPLALATVNNGFAMDGDGIIWKTFLQYIFPWMLDVAKVYCLIRIAQAFYEEKRGGRDSGTGFQALLQHGKWYLVFWLLPVGVELIDQIGHKMFIDMHDKAIIPTSNSQIINSGK